MAVPALHSSVISAPKLWKPTPAVSQSTPIPNTTTNTTTGIEQQWRPTSEPVGITIPEVITGEYHTDYNILYLDQLITQKLAREVKDLPKLYFQVGQLQERKKNAVNIVAYNSIDVEIKKMEYLIREIENGERAARYFAKSKEIIQWYRAHHQALHMVDIHVKSQKDDPHLAKRLMVIEEYLDIAGNYLNLQIVRSYESKTNQCHGCGTDLSKVTPNMEGEVTCPYDGCRTVHNIETTLRMPEVGDHVANYNSGKDESIENFYKAAQRFEAEQTVHILPSVYEELEKYFIKNNCQPSAYIKTLPLNSRGWRGNTSVQMLRKALDAIGESALGKHTILIGKNYWGWQPMKISEYMEDITSDYHKTQAVFHNIPVEIRERDSSLGTEYRLWRHLQLRGCKCYFDMFMIASDDSFAKHENIWKMMCEGANDPAIFFINHKDPL